MGDPLAENVPEVPAVKTRGVRLRNDPLKYVRMVKGRRFQARPVISTFEGGAGGEGRVNLGCFDTEGEAKKAVLEFWQGKRQPVPPYTFRFSAGDKDLFLVLLPAPPGGKGRIRLGPFSTREQAAEEVRLHANAAAAYALRLSLRLNQ